MTAALTPATRGPCAQEASTISAALPFHLDWEKLADLPDPLGLGGPFAGVSNGVLIVAGGANFPDGPLWEGHAKVWHETICVLRAPEGRWETSAAKLPGPRAYGASISAPHGLVCIGGSDPRRHYRDVFLLEWSDQRIHRHPLPSLPVALANTCAALSGDVIYLAGGRAEPASPTTSRLFLALDLSQLNAGWQELESCPAPDRMLSVAGAKDGEFFLFSGTRLAPTGNGSPRREYLRDAWRYTPAAGWSQLADLPRPAVAAPSPAPLIAGRYLLVISGDDGAHVDFKPESQHPGFSRNLLAYDTKKNQWIDGGPSPISRATTPVVTWDHRAVILSGETRPCVRTPEVQSIQMKTVHPND